MSSRNCARVALAAGLAALVAFAPGAGLRADDDESFDDQPQAAGAPGDPGGGVRSSPAHTGDSDALVQSGPSGEHDPRVGVILAAHPDRDVMICLAGCGGGGPKLVAVRQRAEMFVAPEIHLSREMSPAAGHLAAPPGSVAGDGATPAIGDVICLAGCAGTPGEVVQHAVRLTWIDRGAREDLKVALRDVAARLLEHEAEAGTARAARAHAREGAGQAWVSDHARRHLVEPSLPEVLATLVRSASMMVVRDPAGRR